MVSKLFVVLAVAAAAVNAQSSSGSATAPSPSSTAGVSACILGCVTPAAVQNGCGQVSNTTCICGFAQFQADAAACLTQNCPNDLQAALALQQQQCANSGVTPSGSATPRPVSFSSAGASPTGNSSPTGSASSTASAPPSTSSKAAGSIVEASVVGIVGAILAGALAL